MRMSFHQIAYEALEVCNALEMGALEDAVTQAGVEPGARALDIGCGNGAVSIRLAETFGMRVDAVEHLPAMADLARRRIEAAGVADRVRLHRARSSEVLAAQPAWDLIVALGVTEPVGDGVRDPQGMLAGLKPHLSPGGHLLWGDMTWLAEPSPPLRQLVEIHNTYADEAGWRAAAEAAGYEVLGARISPAETWDQYRQTMQAAVADWLAANPDHQDAASVAATAHRLKLMFDFGQGTLGFGLYRLRPV